MYITEVPDSTIINLQKDMRTRKVRFLILSAGVSDSFLCFMYKILIFEDKELSKETNYVDEL